MHTVDLPIRALSPSVLYRSATTGRECPFVNVGELRAALDGVPDDYIVAVGYEGTYSTFEVEASVTKIHDPNLPRYGGPDLPAFLIATI